MKLPRLAAALGVLLLANSALTPLRAEDAAPPSNDGTALPYPYPPHPFAGRLGPTEAQSVPDFHLTAPVKAPAGAPNILLILTDDVGFGASSTFGGPISTPNLDQLAAHGLRYNEFQTTAICSATRAALLTGRNHHEVGTPAVVEITSPYPGYDGIIPKSAATIARILTDNGYNTAMFGKHHNTPNEENSPAGPMDRWPLGLGFQHFYGFIGGDADQYRPNLVNDNTRIDDPHRPKGYLLDKDLADHAIQWIHAQKAAAPDKPFFVYYAPGTAHAPHQAPADWIARFRGKFDGGWDRLREETLARQKAMGIVPANTDLAPRPKQIPAWDSLSPEEKRVDARYAEVYAGMLDYEDAQIGRVLDEIKRMGLSDNTMVVFIEGDNGASAEGGPAGTIDELVGIQGYDDAKTVDHWLAQHLDIMGGPRSEEGYPAGWALAMDTPFPWFKQIASHLGGVRNGLVISWPGHIKDEGQIRSQYHHVIDIMPTLLDVAHVKAPQEVDGIAQERVDGVSMAYSFDQPNAPSSHGTQYYEMLGNRGIYHDGWLANTTPRNMPWDITQFRPGSDVTTYNWELYDLKTDYGQAHDLAAKDPGRLKDMQALFDQEAERNDVYPIQDSGATYRAARMIRAQRTFRSQYVFWGKDVQLPNVSSPPIFSLPFRIDAQLDVPNHANGVILAGGSLFGGWSFYLKDGRPVAFASASNLPWQQSRIAGDKPLAVGHNDVKFDFSPAGQGGTLTISVNGTQVAHGEIRYRPRVMAGIDETFDIGRDTGVPVSDEYQDEGVFTGDIDKVEVNLAMPASGGSVLPSQPREPD